MPKISIITTTYKHQDFIAQTIESVLAQTYTDWELLIGDDSPDNATWDIIQKYVDKYPDKIKAWYHSPNKGIVDNMNFLIEEASDESDYISFLEGDDMYTPDNLEEKMKVFEECPEVKLVYTHHQFVDKNGNKTQGSPSKLLSSGLKIWDLEGLLKIGNPIHSFSSVMIRKNHLISFLPLNTPMQYQGMYGPLDYWTRTKILPSIYIYGINKKLLLYRKQDNNYTKQVALFNDQLELIYNIYINESPSIYTICKKYICINRVIKNTFLGKSSFMYIYQNFSYLNINELLRSLVLSFIGLLPKVVGSFIIKTIQNIKYRNA